MITTEDVDSPSVGLLAEAWAVELVSSTPSTWRPIWRGGGQQSRCKKKYDKVYLVLEVIPPVGPSLLDTTFLLDDGVLDGSTKNTESHSNTMIIVAMDASALLELLDRTSINLQPIVQLLRLDTELGYKSPSINQCIVFEGNKRNTPS